MEFRRTLALGLLAVVMLLGRARLADAAIIYGDVEGANVRFEAIYEDSVTNPGVGLYQVNSLPGPVASGDQLVFSPSASFGAQSQFGATTNSFTDGFLGLFIQSKGNNGLNQVIVRETLNYSFFGAGTVLTQSQVVAPVHLEVLERNGVVVNEPVITQNLVFNLSGGSFDIVADPQTGNFQGITSFNVGNATRVQITMNNQLFAISEATSIASINKNQFDINVIADPVPEPSSFVLLGLGAIGLFWMRRRGALGRI